MKIRLARPFLSNPEILEELDKALKAGMVGQGEKVRDFEKSFSEWVGSKYAVACSSCTAALHMALICVGVGVGDEVMMPAFTFPSCGNMVLQLGAKPVLVDVDEETFTLNPTLLQEAYNPKVKAIIPTHLFGHPADMKPILEFAEEKGIHVIEDAAGALGTHYMGVRVGVIGEIGCFSFHPRKHLTTGEGGMLVTNDEKIAEKAMMLRNHGVKRENERLTFSLPGFNYRLSDVQAILGIAQLKDLDETVAEYRKIAKRYAEKLSSKSLGIIPPLEKNWAYHSYQAYVVRITEKFRTPKDSLIEKLKSNYGVETQTGSFSLRKIQYFNGARFTSRRRRPVCDILHDETLALPMYRGLSESDQTYIVRALEDLYENP